MSKDQNDNRNQQTDSMSKEKTNQDFNKQKPNPADPNQTHQIGEDDERENNSRKVTAENAHKSTGNPSTETSHNTHSTDNHKTEKQNSDKGTL
jgi:hypothetical protein